MSGKSGSKRSRGEKSRPQDLPDYLRDVDEEEDAMSEGGGADNEGVEHDPTTVLPRVVFPELAESLPSLPKAHNARNKQVVNVQHQEDLSRRNFCSYRFINYYAHLDAITDIKLIKKGAPEKVFPRSSEMPEALGDIFEREKLDNWFRIVEGRSSSSIVREFLANSRHWKGQEAKDCRHIFCRGRFVEITPKHIADIIGFVPLTAPCAYYGQLSSPGCIAEVSKFCFGENPERWVRGKSLEKWKVANKALMPEARWVCELLENWILGITIQPIYTFKLCTLAYCLWKGARIDVSWFIYESLMERRLTDCKKGPGHAFLILALVKMQGVTLSGIHMDIEIFPERRYEKIPGVKGNKPVKEKAKEKEKEAGSSSGTPSDLAATLARLERKIDRQERRRVADRTERDRQFEHSREGRRKIGAMIERWGQWHINECSQQHMPPPPATSPWYDSEGYEYPNYDQDTDE